MYLERTNPHPRDARVSFFSGLVWDAQQGKSVYRRYYMVDGEKLENSSVSTLKGVFVPNTFDAVRVSKGNVALQKQWAANGRAAADFGTMHHEQFECYLDQDPQLTEEQRLQNFVPHKKYPQYQRYEDLPAWAHFQWFLVKLEP